MTGPESMPWEWRIAWEDPEAGHQEIALGRQDAVLLVCQLRHQFGKGISVTIDRRRQGDSTWEPADWWSLWHGLNGSKRAQQRYLPGWLPTVRPAWIDR